MPEPASTPTLFLTGAGGNLGRAVIEIFSEQGYRITGTLRPGETVPLEKFNTGARLVPVDLLNETAVQHCIEETIRLEGQVDAAVLTAGGFSIGDLCTTDSAAILEQYRLNVETAYHAARPLLMHMLQKNKGRIFLLGARAGLDTAFGKGLTAYSLSKSLLFRLAELMNLEAAGSGVVTTVVVPSIIDTPENRASMPGADFSKWVQPQTIARILLWHCSPEAADIRDPVLKIYGNA